MSITLAGQTENAKFLFGTTQGHNVPAWKLMELLALRQVTDGKWEKAGDGYVLHGKPKDFGPRPDPEQAKAHKKAYEDQVAKAAKARADFAKFAKLHPLRLDLKLQARLTVVEKNPKLSDLLDRLAESTGLSLTVADNLRYHDPDLGPIDFKNEFAFSLMEMIAERDLDDGRWEKTDDGYRLEGVSRALRPPPPRSFGWAWATGGILLTLAAAGGTFVIYRRRSKQQGFRR